MARFHFDIQENDRYITDEVGSVFEDDEEVRQLALTTGASIAHEAFVEGSASQIVIEVRKDHIHFMRVSISLKLD
jgi:hypothetical protein